MNEKITVYSDANYRGKSQEFGVGRYDIQSLSVVGNDSISSIRLAGLRVRVWENAGFTGASQVILSDCPNLKSLKTDSSRHDWNDKISSLEVDYMPSNPRPDVW